MNNERRKQLAGAIEEITKAKALLEAIDYGEVTDLLESAKTAIAGVQESEQEAFDNMSENLQQGERGQRIEEIAGQLEQTVGNIDELISSINEQDLTGGFDDVIGELEGCQE